LNKEDFIRELACSQATSQLPLTVLARSIDPVSAALSTATLEAMLQDHQGSESATPVAISLYRKIVSRYCLMLPVLGFIIAGLFGAKYVMLPVYEDVLGPDHANLRGAGCIDLAIWVSFLLCPICLLVLVLVELLSRRTNTSVGLKQVQNAMERSIAREKLECAIWLCILAVILMLLGLVGILNTFHFCEISM